MSKPKDPGNFFYKIKNPEVGKAYAEDKIQDDFLTSEEKTIGQDLELEYKKVSKKFEAYLETEYVRLDYRMNLCMVKRCYNNLFSPRETVRSCALQCQQGLSSMNNFISKLMEETNEELSTCLQNVQGSNDGLDESFKCYKKSIDRFVMMRKIISQEFSFFKS